MSVTVARFIKVISSAEKLQICSKIVSDSIDIPISPAPLGLLPSKKKAPCGTSSLQLSNHYASADYPRNTDPPIHSKISELQFAVQSVMFVSSSGSEIIQYTSYPEWAFHSLPFAPITYCQPRSSSNPQTSKTSHHQPVKNAFWDSIHCCSIIACNDWPMYRRFCGLETD